VTRAKGDKKAKTGKTVGMAHLSPPRATVAAKLVAMRPAATAGKKSVSVSDTPANPRVATLRAANQRKARTDWEPIRLQTQAPTADYIGDPRVDADADERVSIFEQPGELPAPTIEDDPGRPEGDAANAAITKVRCSIDATTDRGIDGWVMIPTHPSHRCVVALKEGSKIHARTVASRFRPDLQAAGIGDGCHAFLLPMPRPLLDGAEHNLEVIELSTGRALTAQPIVWRSTAGTADSGLTSKEARLDIPPQGAGLRNADRGSDGYRRLFTGEKKSTAGESKSGAAARLVETRIMFDVSDLVYYIGHHPNLTGIQRVQSSIILSIVAQKILSPDALVLMSFNARNRRWSSVPTGFFISLLEDLLKPEPERLISFPMQDAREGILPGATEFDGVGVLDDGAPTTFCLLGAAWVQRDYFHRILNFKRQFGVRLVVTIHDLIPIYARETCDQGTAKVFEQFLRRALRHTDHFLCVSEYTAKDLKRYASSLSLPTPPITVSRNGSSFEEFLPQGADASEVHWEGLPERYVLFVATIEGRKNHRLMFEIWRRMVEAGGDPPHLICVGRVGWKSEPFIAGLVETNYLDGKVILLKDVSDEQLHVLYARCMFTLCPSQYEGWGLPVGESLAAGKVCVSSDRASIPEVAGNFGVYIDIHDADKSLSVIRGLIDDPTLLNKLTTKVRRGYEPITWRSVAERVVAACVAAARDKGANPYVLIPYSTETSFASPPARESDGIFGEDLVAHVVEARKGLFLFESLHEAHFLRGEDARSGKNWAEPENWGTWLCHTGGEVTFELPPTEASVFYVYLRLRASGPLAEMRVRLSAEGSVLWHDCLGSRPRNIMLRVRRKARATGGWRLRLQAEAQLTPEMREKVFAVDSRVPTIGFERMVVLPEDDLKTRVDMLSVMMTSPEAAVA
jgi:glycosyltransferase involved in cell wall biosynthesis